MAATLFIGFCRVCVLPSQFLSSSITLVEMCLYSNKVVLCYLSPVCGGLLDDTEGSFSSPGFPQNYPNMVHCIWGIFVPQGSTLKITFTDFNTEEW